MNRRTGPTDKSKPVLLAKSLKIFYKPLRIRTAQYTTKTKKIKIINHKELCRSQPVVCSSSV